MQKNKVDILPTLHFTFPVTPALTPGLRTICLDSDHPKRGRQIREVAPDAWSINYNPAYAGRYRVHPSKDWLERPPGLARIFRPGIRHESDYASPQPIPRIAILFDGEEQIGLDKLLGETTPHIRIHDHNRALGKTLQAIGMSVLARGQNGIWAAHQHFLSCIDLIFQARRDDRTGELHLGNERPADDEAFVENVRRIIREQYMHPLTLSQIAKDARVSPSKLSHNYSRLTGISPIKTLQAHRISIGKQMLADGYSLQQIADACGYCSPFHFSKAFRKSEGIPPKTYRETTPTRTLGF